MAVIVPYRSSGSSRAMIERTLSTVGTRVHGRMSFVPDPRRNIQPVTRGFADLGCGCSPALSYEAAKRHPLGRLGALGSASGAVSAASSAASGAAAGSVAGPIGAVVGGIIGLAKGLLTKTYLNVAQMNAAEQTEVSAFTQYQTIAGKVAGRDIGYATLNTVFNGAVHSGIFPINKDRQCFHEGCSTYPGNASWSNQAMQGGSSDKNTMPDVVPKAIAAGVFDPRVILQQYWIPAQQAKGNHWAVPSNNIGQQLLTDIIDAYVAAHVPNVPYFYPAAAPPSLPPVVNAPVVPVPVAFAAAPPTMAAPVCAAPYVWNGTQCALPASTGATTPGVVPTAQQCAPPYVWNGTQCVLPTNAVPPSTAPPPASVPANFSPVGTDASGNPIFASPQGVLYSWSGAGMTQFNGQLSQGSSAAAQMQAALQNSLAQGQSAQQAAAAALQQAQSAGVAVTPQLQQQVAAQTEATQAAPIAAGVGGGLSLGNTAAILSIGATLLGLAFATARPAKRTRGKSHG